MMARAVHLNENSTALSRVLTKNNGLRLIVSARGAFYPRQERAGNGWTRVPLFPTGRVQTFYVSAALDDPAPLNCEATGLLSDDPGDCDRAPRKSRMRVAP